MTKLMAAPSKLVGRSELTSQIHQQLHDDGVFDEITAAIRARILQSLLDENGSSAKAVSANDLNDQETMALLSLVYHFLEQKKMTHTLSVFAAESQMEHSEYPLSSVDAAKALGLEAILDKFAEGNADIELLPLLQAVSKWISAAKRKVSIAVQTDRDLAPLSCDDDGVGLEDNKENVCVEAREQKGFGTDKSIERRLIEIERECQLRMRHEMNEKLKVMVRPEYLFLLRQVAFCQLVSSPLYNQQKTGQEASFHGNTTA